MLGDNFYGSQKPADLEKKFARPYKPLLDAGVIFQPLSGTTTTSPPSTIRRSTWAASATTPTSGRNVRFFVLDTNVLDAAQLAWAETALQQSREAWKIAYFHHPLYGNAGRHGSNVDLRVLLEPCSCKYGVQVVFSGHDHVYERLEATAGDPLLRGGFGRPAPKG